MLLPKDRLVRNVILRAVTTPGEWLIAEVTEGEPPRGLELMLSRKFWHAIA